MKLLESAKIRLTLALVCVIGAGVLAILGQWATAAALLVVALGQMVVWLGMGYVPK